MVSLPKEYVATKYDGYFWNINNQSLYSIKRGYLHKLKVSRLMLHAGFGYFGPRIQWMDGYQVSVNGRKRVLLLKDLKKLKTFNAKIPVEG